MIGSAQAMRARRFDAWPVHSTGVAFMNSTPCASGQYVANFTTDLISNDEFFYPIAFFDSDDDCKKFLAGNLLPPYGNGVVGYIGEWFNGSIRSQIFDKIAAADWNDWLLAH